MALTSDAGIDAAREVAVRGVWTATLVGAAYLTMQPALPVLAGCV